MRNYNINIYQSELLCTKSKSVELINIIFFLNGHFTFSTYNILTGFFKELKNIYKNDYQ